MCVCALGRVVSLNVLCSFNSIWSHCCIARSGQRKAAEVKFEPPAKKMVGVQHPQDNICVGDRGVFSTTVVTDGPGIGPGAVGPDLERSDRVNPCYTATSCRPPTDAPSG